VEDAARNPEALVLEELECNVISRMWLLIENMPLDSAADAKTGGAD